ncbi:MAG: hypothetical protein HQL30_07200, partial [Candidatus Omnitrophica bacterium]|nr:hypothetical protein [Candidatus Omnitrophota bacterium]
FGIIFKSHGNLPMAGHEYKFDVYIDGKPAKVGTIEALPGTTLKQAFVTIDGSLLDLGVHDITIRVKDKEDDIAISEAFLRKADYRADLNSDGFVDMADYAIFMKQYATASNMYPVDIYGFNKPAYIQQDYNMTTKIVLQDGQVRVSYANNSLVDIAKDGIVTTYRIIGPTKENKMFLAKLNSGDMNGDGAVDWKDGMLFRYGYLDAQRNGFASYDPKLDIDMDGNLDIHDVEAFSLQKISTGDLSKVNAAGKDYFVARQYNGVYAIYDGDYSYLASTDPTTQVATLADGRKLFVKLDAKEKMIITDHLRQDTNRDGVVDGADRAYLIDQMKAGLLADAASDIDGDGNIDMRDLVMWDSDSPAENDSFSINAAGLGYFATRLTDKRLVMVRETGVPGVYTSFVSNVAGTSITLAAGGYSTDYLIRMDSASGQLMLVKHVAGDVNADGFVDKADYTDLTDMIGKGNYVKYADVNGDGQVNGKDLVAWQDQRPSTQDIERSEVARADNTAMDVFVIHNLDGTFRLVDTLGKVYTTSPNKPYFRLDGDMSHIYGVVWDAKALKWAVMEYVKPDVNHDGKINADDLALVRVEAEKAVRLKNMYPYNEFYDINADGKVTDADILSWKDQVPNENYIKKINIGGKTYSISATANDQEYVMLDALGASYTSEFGGKRVLLSDKYYVISRNAAGDIKLTEQDPADVDMDGLVTVNDLTIVRMNGYLYGRTRLATEYAWAGSAGGPVSWVAQNGKMTNSEETGPVANREIQYVFDVPEGGVFDLGAQLWWSGEKPSTRPELGIYIDGHAVGDKRGTILPGDKAAQGAVFSRNDISLSAGKHTVILVWKNDSNDTKESVTIGNVTLREKAVRTTAQDMRADINHDGAVDTQDLALWFDNSQNEGNTRKVSLDIDGHGTKDIYISYYDDGKYTVREDGSKPLYCDNGVFEIYGK